MSIRKKDSYSIQSVDNALDVLEALCEEGDEIRVSHLSERLGMTKMSLFRYLATFENRGYVEKVKDSHKYRLGLSAYEIGQKFLSRMGLLRKAKPVIEQFVRNCNEAVYLAVARGKEVLLLDMVDTTHQVRIIPLVGSKFPMSQTTAGRVMLAFGTQHRNLLPKPELAEISSSLAVISKQGGAYDVNGFGDGIASVSVPLIDGQGLVQGCLCLVGPDFRLTEGRVEDELLPGLIDAGVIVSSKMGYVGHISNKLLY
ncbi:MAG TPA: IclR family transcriptional regulator [Desulfuromonadales bacterium]|nr:IclR family transcriptional regulator [Desulfuromonadales bacterium]